MKVMIRLYKQHDLDLISLYETNNFSLPKEMKNAIKSYVAEESYFIELPKEIDAENFPKAIQFHICLSPDKDADVIKWLKSITPGYRNCVLKNVFRSYMEYPITYPYMEDVNMVKRPIRAQNAVVIKKDDVIESNVKFEDKKTVKNTVLNEKTSNLNQDDASILDDFENMLNNF